MLAIREDRPPLPTIPSVSHEVDIPMAGYRRLLGLLSRTNCGGVRAGRYDGLPRFPAEVTTATVRFLARRPDIKSCALSATCHGSRWCCSGLEIGPQSQGNLAAAEST